MIHDQLTDALNEVVARYQSLRFWRAMAVGWGLASVVGLLLNANGVAADQQASTAISLLGALAAVLVVISAVAVKSIPINRIWVARQIEAAFPELRTCLLAAIEQQPALPDGRFGFLQESVIRQALHHAESHAWPQVVPSRRVAAAMLTQFAAMCVFVLILIAPPRIVTQGSTTAAKSDVSSLRNSGAFSVVIEPGDTEIERGNSLLVLARVQGNLPADATLIVTPPTGEPTQIAMSRSLNDPVFGGRVASVKEPFAYHVELGGQKTPTYHVTVFEYPRVERADAKLLFPGYTGQDERLVQDVRTVSVVEGAQVTLICHLNKRVRSATLVPKNEPMSEPMALDAVAGDKPDYQVTLTAQTTRRFKLELRDEKDRRGVEAFEFTLHVVPNQPPTLKLVQPARDLEVSPLEELDVKAIAWDDFGIKRMGLSFAIAGQTLNDVVLGENGVARKKHELADTIKFEELKAEPDQLLSYFFWAEDVGPDGQARRTMSDMYFAEVRHFEEIFRQGQQPPGGQQQQQQQQQQNSPAGQQAQQNAAEQKDLINATWKLIRRETGAQPTPAFDDDVGQLVEAQAALLEKTKGLGDKLTDPESQEHLSAVLEAMLQAIKHLTEAHEQVSVAPLHPALAAEQAAYQALLKLRAREHEVVRQQQRQQQSSQSRQQASARSQQQRQQMQQLDLKNEQNRYEAEKQAPSQPESAADRENRQVLNRLRELAQRQHDLNERLKDLQTALQEAQTEQRREEIRQQLKRLQEEQREVLRDTDELQSRMESPENQQQMTNERQQLEQTREQVRRAAESLEQEMVSQATAAGTRAEKDFEELRNEFRRRASNRFNEEMREMRESARELERQQQQLSRQLNGAAPTPTERTPTDSDPKANRPDDATSEAKSDARGTAQGNSKSSSRAAKRSLRDENKSDDLVKGLAEQRERLSNLKEQMTRTIQEAEESEPLLVERLYEAARNVEDQKVDRALEAAGRSLQRGLQEDAQQVERIAGQGITQLREGVEKAAEAVLGDETEALRRAREQLQELSRQLNREIARNSPDDAARMPQPRDDQPRQPGQQQPGQQQPGQQQPGQQQPGQQQPGQRGQRGQLRLDDNNRVGDPRSFEAGNGHREFAPIAGDDFLDWSDRLRDVEEMIDDPELRAEAARIRDQARAIRAEQKRHSKEPNWGLVRVKVAEPLVELSNRVAEELLRRSSQKAIVPLDRDPVPPKYAEKTRQYYERLGSGK
jgi:hypothetical protein